MREACLQTMPAHAVPEVAQGTIGYDVTNSRRTWHNATTCKNPRCLPDARLLLRLLHACSSNALVVRLLANFLVLSVSVIFCLILSQATFLKLSGTVHPVFFAADYCHCASPHTSASPCEPSSYWLLPCLQVIKLIELVSCHVLPACA